MFTAKDRQRQNLIRQQGELKRNLRYSPKLTDEEKASLQMQIDSLERRINATIGNEDIITPVYNYGITPNVSNKKVDIFSPEPNEVSDETKAWLFSGYDSGVPTPEKTEPTYNYVNKYTPKKW